MGQPIRLPAERGIGEITSNASVSLIVDGRDASGVIDETV